MKIKFKQWLIISILLISILPIISAVSLNNSIIFTNDTKLNVTINNPIYFTSLIVENDYIYLGNYNLYDPSNEYLTINITESNKSYTESDLPYFSESTGTNKVITSNISNIVGILVTNTSLDCSNIGWVKYTPANGSVITWLNKNARNLCSSGIITINPVVIGKGSNTLEISSEVAKGSICSGFFDAGVSFTSFIILVIIASIAGIVILFMTNMGSSEDGDMSGTITIASIIIVGAIVLIIGMIIINNINGC